MRVRAKRGIRSLSAATISSAGTLAPTLLTGKRTPKFAGGREVSGSRGSPPMRSGFADNRCPFSSGRNNDHRDHFRGVTLVKSERLLACHRHASRRRSLLARCLAGCSFLRPCDRAGSVFAVPLLARMLLLLPRPAPVASSRSHHGRSQRPHPCQQLAARAGDPFPATPCRVPQRADRADGRGSAKWRNRAIPVGRACHASGRC